MYWCTLAVVSPWVLTDLDIVTFKYFEFYDSYNIYFLMVEISKIT